jgi:DNA ligase (NAD+)
MKSAEEIKSLINDIFLLGDGSFDEFETSDLIDVLVAAQKEYDIGKSIISDQQFDALYHFVQTADSDNTYFLGVGSEVRGGKVKLPYTMGSLTQVYDGDTIKWVHEHDLESQEMVITEKLDGISTLIVYDANGKLQIAYSRGDGIEGADITRHVSKITSVPKQISGPMVVRAEIIFTKKRWEAIKRLIKRSGGAFYKNARNATAGLMNATESDPIAYQNLSVVAYEILSQDMNKEIQLDTLNGLGFDTPSTLFVYGKRLNDKHLADVLNSIRTDSEYEIDGIVIDVASNVKRVKMGMSGLNPEYARKFKMADASNMAIATVKEVQWHISKNGYLKPRVKIHPIELVGVTVQHATGFNAAFIFNNGIGPGAKIRVTRSGDTIPFIISVVESVKPQMPTEDFTWTVNKDGKKVDAVVTNVHDNDTVKLEQLIDFFGKIGTEYLGEGNLKIVFDSGFTSIEEVINLSESEWISMIGANGKKIFKSIREKLTNTPWHLVAGSHPCFGRGIGRKKMKRLYDAFKGDMNKLNNIDAMLTVEGFDIKTATKISSGFTAFLIFKNNIGIKFAEYEAPKSGGLSGSTFLFTGFRSPELEAKVVEQGGKMSSSVSSKLTYLVAADVNESSGKLNKARDIGTKIITREQLEEML